MPLYSFGPFQLDSESRRSDSRHRAPLSLPDRHLEVLLQLVAASQYHSHQERVDRLRPGATSPSPTTASNRRSRDCGASLGDAPLIETVPRRGYRFTASVTRSVRRESDERLMALLAPHSAWLEGRSILETLDRERVSTAEAAFQRALVALPDAAPPHVGLANACVFRFESTRSQDTPDTASLERAMMHAREACRLEPGLAESWATLGFVLEPRRCRRGASPRRAGRSSSSPTTGVISCDWRSSAGAKSGCARRIVRCGCCPGWRWRTCWRPPSTSRGSRSTRPNTKLEAGIAAQDAQPSSGTRFGAVGLQWLRGLLHLRAGGRDGGAGIVSAGAGGWRRRSPLRGRMLRQRPLRDRRHAPGRTAMWPAPLPRSIARCRWRRASRWREPLAPCCRRTVSAKRGVCSSRPDSIDSERIA